VHFPNGHCDHGSNALECYLRANRHHGRISELSILFGQWQIDESQWYPDLERRVRRPTIAGAVPIQPPVPACLKTCNVPRDRADLLRGALSGD